jgi:hypothetical protein
MAERVTPKISRFDQVRLAATGAASLRTIDKAYSGERIGQLARFRITKAAEALGLPLPVSTPVAGDANAGGRGPESQDDADVNAAQTPLSRRAGR